MSSVDNNNSNSSSSDTSQIDGVVRNVLEPSSRTFLMKKIVKRENKSNIASNPLTASKKEVSADKDGQTIQADH